MLCWMFPQEWKCERTHPEADENLCGGDAGDSVRWWLRERGQGKSNLADHISAWRSIKKQ